MVLNSVTKGQIVPPTDDKGLEGRPGMLLGRFPHRLDPKRRITIPAPLRSLMGNPGYVYVMPDLNSLKCLNILPPEELESRLSKLRQAALSDARVAAFATRVGAISEMLAVDVQGRIRIRDRLLAYAGVDKDVVLIGALNRIQVWAADSAPEEEEALRTFVEAAREVNF
jgi:MraZ protein